MTRYIGILDGKAGVFGVHFPDLPGCMAMGKTLDAVYSDAVEAIRAWSQDAIADGETLPTARDMEALRADPDVVRDLGEGVPSSSYRFFSTAAARCAPTSPSTPAFSKPSTKLPANAA